MAEQNKDKELKELIVARLEVLPSDVRISIGSLGSFTRDELITHVKKNDKIGKKITEVELEYLKLLKEGIFYEKTVSDYQTSV